MARHADREAVYEVADLFRQRCLVEGRSLLWPDQAIWTLGNLDALWDSCFRSTNSGGGKEGQYWDDSIKDQSTSLRMIAADASVLVRLFDSTTKQQTKIGRVRKPFEWDDTSEPDVETWGLVHGAFERGIGDPGLGFRYHGQTPAVEMVVRFGKRVIEERLDTSSVSTVKSVLDNLLHELGNNASIARHMFLHLLFPDDFEGIASSNHKQKIFQTFANEAGVDLASDLDEGLLAIREFRDATYGEQSTHYYHPDIKALWDSPKQKAGEIADPVPEPVEPEAPPPTNPVSTLDALARKTHLDESFLREIDELLTEKGQLIFEGPPGSGKTFVAEHFAYWFTGQSIDGGPNDHVEIVQFHQSYGYEDFVQGIRPETSTSGQLTYNVRDGIFLNMCLRAKDRPGEKFVLLIDEINRGNISRIFGELLLLLEYRDKRARLPYATGSDPYISIPKNLFIIGTMNSADRSLAQVDYALRRRFYFVRFMPVENNEATVLARWLQAQHLDNPVRQRVLARFVALNLKVSEHLSPDFQIGHSYFMNANVGHPAGFDRVWTRAIQPLLEEYFHHHRERAAILTEIRTLMIAVVPDAMNEDESAEDILDGAIAG